MKYYGKAEAVAKQILESFESGEIPGALAQVFIHRKDNVPCNNWSWSNRVAVMFSGTNDARGFCQWDEVGRKVKKGSRAIHILAPCMRNIEVENSKGEKEKKKIIYGFKSVPVFRLEDTEVTDAAKWAEATTEDREAQEWLDHLPLVDVAREWGLTVDSYNGANAGYLGVYRHGMGIRVGTENLSTWAHELVHAADDKKGTIVKAPGQNAGNETVAEFGGAILLKILGYDTEADLGGCLDYIKGYADGNKDKALSRAMRLINRTCDCIELILSEAERIGSIHAEMVA